MITKTINLYEYGELSSLAKERVRQWYLNDPMRSVKLSEYFSENWLISYFPKSNLCVEWSMNNSHGDGVNIYGKLMLVDVLEYICNWNTHQHPYCCAYSPSGVFTLEDITALRVYITSINGYAKVPVNPRYTSCVANQIDFSGFLVENYNNCKNQIDQQLIQKFQNEAIRILTSLCGEMEQFGYDYLYNISEQEIIQACNEKNLYFTANGECEEILIH